VRIIFSFLLTLTVIPDFAQETERWLLGTGLTYCSYLNHPGINLNVTYRLGKHIHIGPDFSAILTRESQSGARWTKKKELEFNLNSQYYFSISEKLKCYPLTGLNVSKATNHIESSKADVRWIADINAGAGTELHFSNVRFFVEGKHVIRLSKYDLTIGLLVPL
jgi:hypothetical protein